jgi:hypothetical protein
MKPFILIFFPLLLSVYLLAHAQDISPGGGAGEKGEPKKQRETNKIFKSYFTDTQSAKKDSTAVETPPSITSDMVDAWVKEVELDSSSQKLSYNDYEKRLNRLAELYHHTHMLNKYAVAYAASEDKLKKLMDIKVRIVRSMAYARYSMEEIKKGEGAIVRKKMRNLYIHDVYDVEKKTFVNIELLNEMKSNIFHLGYPINFRCPVLGKFVPGCEKFGMNPKHSADGIRISLDDNYNLIILRISQTQEVKLVLWNKGFIKIGESRIVDVF